MVSLGEAARSARVLARAGLLRPYLPDQVLGMGLSLARYGVSLASVYALGAARSSRRLALVDERGAVTFGAMDDRASAVAAGLADRGLRAGDRVGVLCRNHRGFADATVGLAKLGADAVFLNTGMAGPQLAEVLEREGGTAVIVDEELVVATADVAPRRVRILAGQIEALATGPRRQPPPTRRPGRQIILTSGTTGAPKGAHRHGANSGAGALVGLLSVLPLRAGDVTYVAAPLFHAWGFAHMALAGVLGSTLVLRRRFDAEATLQLIEEQRVTVLAAVPVMLQRIMELPAAVRAAYDISSLRVAVVSGSPLPPELPARFMDSYGEVLYNLYGSTEVALVSVASPADLRAAPTTAGRPPRGTVVKLLGPDDEEVATGRPGRVFVGNDLLFAGYTGGGGKAVVAGFMSTGDTGHVDERGLLFVDGREDDMIISGGENLYPLEVEAVLHQHPAVADVCVVGAPDAEWGQRLRAFVVLSPEPVTAEELRGFVKARLAGYKVPRDVVFVGELPRNATGKVLRHQLATDEAVLGPA